MPVTKEDIKLFASLNLTLSQIFSVFGGRQGHKNIFRSKSIKSNTKRYRFSMFILCDVH